jgi:hypothetical protein
VFGYAVLCQVGVVATSKTGQMKALSLVGRLREKAKGLAYVGVTELFQWESGERKAKRLNYRPLIWRLTLGCLFLLPVVGATYSWQQESGESAIADLAAGIAWTCYFIVQLALIVVVIAATYRCLAAHLSWATSPKGKVKKAAKQSRD